MIGMIFDIIGVRDECQHGDAIPVSQQIAECAVPSRPVPSGLVPSGLVSLTVVHSFIQVPIKTQDGWIDTGDIVQVHLPHSLLYH